MTQPETKPGSGTPASAKPTAEADVETAAAFATSWNNLPAGSVYTVDQFVDWMTPLTREVVRGARVLELGCGNASLLTHMAGWRPAFLEGVDLGDSVRTARENMERTGATSFRIVQADLTTYAAPTPRDRFDLVYCIGVLHHLRDPKAGFDAMIRCTRPGGRFHGWVYAREGNGVVVHVVDPIRKVASRLPWWLTKYGLATPLSLPFYAYAKALGRLPEGGLLTHAPLYEYARWIAKREWSFFRHVAFDQLVTPQTTYIARRTVDAWLMSDPRIDPASTYVVFRNGNSWKFGGRVREAD